VQKLELDNAHIFGLSCIFILWVVYSISALKDSSKYLIAKQEKVEELELKVNTLEEKVGWTEDMIMKWQKQRDDSFHKTLKGVVE